MIREVIRRGLLIPILIGFIIGAGASLYYTWNVNPRILTDIQPNQLSQQAKRDYLVALSMAFANDHDAPAAANRLVSLQMNWQDLADAACDMVQTGYASGGTGHLVALRSMVQLAQSQGKKSCASDLVPAPTSIGSPTELPVKATDTLVPPPSKTPLPTLDVTFTPPALEVSATPIVTGDFVVSAIPICDANSNGLIGIYVQDLAGTGIPGIAIEVDTSTDKQVFFTGLKPEIDTGYADFQMTTDESYTVSLRDLNGGRTKSLKASACKTTSGEQSITSYRVVFRHSAARQ